MINLRRPAEHRKRQVRKDAVAVGQVALKNEIDAAFSDGTFETGRVQIPLPEGEKSYESKDEEGFHRRMITRNGGKV